MKNYKIFLGFLAVAAAIATCVSPTRAQVAEAATATAAADVVGPVITKVVSTIAPKRHVHDSWLKAEVIRADANTIIVSERDNERMIHTFSFGPEIKDKMQVIADKGGYQYGDKVSILVSPDNTTIALKIFGKPSKSL
jgi:hypothetical protein